MSKSAEDDIPVLCIALQHFANLGRRGRVKVAPVKVANIVRSEQYCVCSGHGQQRMTRCWEEECESNVVLH